MTAVGENIGPSEAPRIGQSRPTLNVLGVREHGAWCAIGLEMSLRGYGETFDAATEALAEAIEAQVTFAAQHDNLDEIFIPARPRYFRLYADVKLETLRCTLFNDINDVQCGPADYRVGALLLPQPTGTPFKRATA